MSINDWTDRPYPEDDFDPTAFEIDFDPRVQRMRGAAVHGNTPFDVPFISEILPGFWQGGCERGLVLPEFIDHVFSLYIWKEYIRNHDAIYEGIRMYDSLDMKGAAELEEIADRINLARAKGTVLVHCQAGLNRSSLLAGVALVRNGDVVNGKEAVELIRANRSPACLCNPAFEEFLINYEV